VWILIPVLKGRTKIDDGFGDNTEAWGRGRKRGMKGNV
jgi:hypothetical protein